MKGNGETMIDVALLRAKEDFSLGRNATFLQGKQYFGREDKDGDSYVVRSEEGYWIPFLHYKIGYRNYTKLSQFKYERTLYMRNRKKLNEFSDVEEYLNSGHMRK